MALALARLDSHDHVCIPDDARTGRGVFDIDRLVEDYLAGHSAQTAQAYARDIAHLFRHLDARGLDLFGARPGDLARWARAQHDAGVPAATIRRRLAAASGLYCYLESEGLIDSSPATSLRRPRGGFGTEARARCL